MIKDDIADQLVYSTVKITCQNSSSVSTGTGFFMRKELEDGKKITAIVTNKHVVNGYDNAEIVLCQANTEGAADDENHVTIKVPIDVYSIRIVRWIFALFSLTMPLKWRKAKV